MVDFLGVSLSVFAGFVGSIPLYVAYKKYREYKIGEYIYFIGFWISGLSIAVVLALSQFSDHLIYWQIREVAILSFFAMVYFQALRVIEFSTDIKYRSFVIFGLIYLSLGIIAVLFWDYIEENITERLFDLPRTEILSDNEIGISRDGTVFYSTSFAWFRLLFGTISFWTFFYSYFSIKPLKSNPRVMRAHNLWKITAIAGVLFNTFQWLPSFTSLNPDLQSPFAFIAVVCAAIIATRYPEGYLIAKPQITRVLDIYNLIEGPSESMFSKIQMNEADLYDYLMEAKKNLENS